MASSSAASEPGSELEDGDDDEFVDDTRIPVLILTGFLGSGKTTLLNNVLSKPHGRRIAIIENEFGSIDIDSKLIKAKEVVDGVEIVESLNGCACCTVRGDLIDSLVKLLANRKDQFDHIIIETTGLADPRPIISIFLATEMIEHLVLDGVVTLVDARNVERHLDAPQEGEFVNEALQQIAYAERLVLNKIDLVTPEDTERLEKRLKKINGMAQILRTQHADVPIDYVLGLGGYNHLRIAEDLDKTYKEEQKEHSHGHSHSHEEHSHSESSGPHDHATSHEEHHSHRSETTTDGGSSHSHDEEHSHSVNHGDEGKPEEHDAYHSHSHSDSHSHDHGHSHTHNDIVTSVSFTIDQDVDVEKVNNFLFTMVEHLPEDLFRYKGILAVQGEEERYIFQGVHEQISAIKGPRWGPGEKRRSQMVFIGRDLDDGWLEDGFKKCVHNDAK